VVTWPLPMELGSDKMSFGTVHILRCGLGGHGRSPTGLHSVMGFMLYALDFLSIIRWRAEGVLGRDSGTVWRGSETMVEGSRSVESGGRDRGSWE
jgi:hypothetical protein